MGFTTSHIHIKGLVLLAIEGLEQWSSHYFHSPLEFIMTTQWYGLPGVENKEGSTIDILIITHIQPEKAVQDLTNVVILLQWIEFSLV